MLAICAALNWEIRPLLRVIGSARKTRYGTTPVWQSRSRPVVVFRTGIGCNAAAEATQIVLGALPVRTVVNTGCAGALTTDLEAGALVIPRTLLDPANLRHDADDACVARLRGAARRAGLPMNEGPVLTSPRALATAMEKSQANASFGATAVEMEGHAVASVARAHSVRFGSARAILDSSGMDLPVSDLKRNVLGLLFRVNMAGDIPPLPPLANAVKAVQTSLHQLFTCFLDETPGE